MSACRGSPCARSRTARRRASSIAVNPKAPYTVAQESGRVLVRVDADALDAVAAGVLSAPAAAVHPPVGVGADDRARPRPALRVVSHLARGPGRGRRAGDRGPAAGRGRTGTARPAARRPPVAARSAASGLPAAGRAADGWCAPHDRGRRRPRRRRHRRPGPNRRPGEGHDAGAGEAAEERAREPARRARAPHPRRRPGGPPRRPGGARQQQQGRPVRQPPRERVRAPDGQRRSGLRLLRRPRRRRRSEDRDAPADPAHAGRRLARHRDDPLGDGATAPPGRVGCTRRHHRGAVPRPRQDESPPGPAGAAPCARRRQHAGGRGRSRLPHESGRRAARSCRRRSRTS